MDLNHVDLNGLGLNDLDLNLVLLCGRLAAAPDLTELDPGSRMLRLLVTVRSERPRRRIDVIPVSLWDPQESLLDPGLEAGTRIWVVGAVQRRFWDGSEGRRSRLEVVGVHVADFDFLEGIVGACGGL